MEVVRDDLVGVGPVRLLVREVRRPHQLVDAHVVPQLDARAVLLEPPVEVLFDDLAGHRLQRLEPKQFLGPVDVPVVPDVRHLHEEGHPAKVGLQTADLEFREPVEQVREHQLHDVGATDTCEALDLERQLRLLQRVLVLDGVVQKPSVRVGRAVNLDVDGHGHVGIERRRPETGVLRARAHAPVGKRGEHHRVQPQLRAVLYLRDGVLDAGGWNRTHREEPVGRLGGVLLRHPIVPPAEDRPPQP